MTDDKALVERCFLLVKRGLYYRPDSAGYTALKSEAGRYLESDAVRGVNYAVHEDIAGEFSPGAREETKIAHLQSAKKAADVQIASLKAENERLREALVQHNDRLRSAIQIAQRDGRNTNWLTFRGQCHYTAAAYQDIVSDARAALAEQQ